MNANRNLGGMILLITQNGSQNRTALNKLLFFSDLVHYFNEGSTISEDDYQKLDFGPVPKSIEATRTWLVGLEMMTEKLNPYAVYRAYSYSPTDKINFEAVEKDFLGPKLNAINTVVQRLGGMTASTLSAITHEYEPWKSAGWSETLDFKRAYADNELKKWLEDKELLTAKS